MAGQAATVELDLHGLLRAACARNLSAEIHYEEEDELRRARMRLLRVEDEKIYVDQPMCIGKPFSLRPRQPITVYVVVDQVSYSFKSQLIGPHVITDLNRQKRIVGAILKYPQKMHEAQRRHDYRLSLSREQVVATFHVRPADAPDRIALDAVRHEARITNISGGGMAVMFPTIPGAKFRVNDQFWIVFQLPGLEQRFVLPVELRSLRLIQERENTILGLQFRGCFDPENRGQIQAIRQFITDEQRHQLRQMRGG